eukprot:SAG25_NODE_309_length_10042_cov_25.194609_14_plen_94_part_00
MYACNLRSGDELVLGWAPAAARTRLPGRLHPLPLPRSAKLKVEIGPSALCTKEAHVMPTDILVATRREAAARESRAAVCQLVRRPLCPYWRPF